MRDEIKTPVKPARELAALRLQVVQLEEILEQRNRELKFLNQVGEVFVSTLDLDQVLTTVLEEVRHLLGVTACSAWLIDPETNELVCRQLTDPQSQIVRGWRLAPDQGLAGWVARTGQSLIVADAQSDERHFAAIDEQTGLDLHSILSVPLRVKEKVIGVIQVVDKAANRFGQADLTLLESLAATVAISIENARLYEQARRDAKTKSMLLHEINHRVKNNLSAIIGLLYAERRHAGMQDRPGYRAIMTDLINRVRGLATAHNLLSDAEWRPLRLSDLSEQIIQAALQALPPDKPVSVEVSPSPVRVTPKQANGLALIVNELATNSVKYAFQERPRGRIAVSISPGDKAVGFEFRDDGPGYPEAVLRGQRHNVGLYLVQSVVSGELDGEVTLANDRGAVTRIRFQVAE
ncbi:MAG: sensor histidine kinase [Anaerolineae bacterium]